MVGFLVYAATPDLGFLEAGAELVRRRGHSSVWMLGILCMWALLFAVWILGAFGTKQTRSSPQSRLGRLGTLALQTVGFWILADVFQARTAWEAAPAPWQGPLALGLCAIGGTIAVWARVTLGSDWSSAITLKRDHSLVETGPYAVVRHPIYAGWMGVLLGTLILLPLPHTAMAAILLSSAWLWKISTEEKVMRSQFGETYDEYRKRVPALFPGIN